MKETFDYVSDEVLDRLYVDGAVKDRFYKCVRCRREYPALRAEHGAARAKEILASRYKVEPCTVHEYLFGVRWTQQPSPAA